MKEVSCRFFDILLRDLKGRGIEAARLVEGTGISVEHLSRKDERVDWSAFLRMMENARSLWTREELVKLGERSTQGPLVQFIGVVARIRFSVAGFYAWVTAPDGVAAQMITCAKASSRSGGPGQIVVEVRMTPGCPPSDELFLITQGTYAAMPRMMGAAAAHVDYVLLPDGARFEVRFTEPRGVLTSMRRFVTAPFTMRQAAKELTDAHSSLLSRYEELDSTRGQVERQRELLDIAYQLGQKIGALRDLRAIGDTVATTILGQRDITGVRIAIAAYEEVVVERGTTAGVAPVHVDLPGTPPSGKLEAWLTAPDGESRRLLELVAPTIALAIDNAVAYHELAEYQVGLEKLVDQRTAELREAQEAREKFFGNISHEIRTPLSLILLSVADVERRAGTALDERGHAGLGAISDASRKLLRLVDELLLLAAGQADKLVLTPEPTDLKALVGQLRAAWLPAAEAAGLTLLTRTPDAPTFVNVDPVAFERIASNLLSNAVKYTPRGGEVTLELAVEDSIRLSVFDTGPGIDSDLAQRLFGRFERAAGNDRRKAGTGIGLALVKQLVEAHDGTVTAAARSTGGSEFRVTLPKSRIVQALPARPFAAPALRTTHAPTVVSTLQSGAVFGPKTLSAGTIVIAEDEPRLAESIASLLSETYTVHVALDGVGAIELVKQHQPQMLITDVDMPGMNGIELAKRFRDLTGDRLAPIIILSAVIDLGTRLAGLEAGAIDYIGKPFDPSELRARVASQFRMRDLAMRLHRAEHLSSLGILTSGLAHELRNPANGIVNAIPPLRMLIPAELSGPDSDIGQLLDAMKSSGDQIAFLVKQLLGFRHQSELDLRPADLDQIVRRGLGLAKEALTGIDVKVEIAVNEPVMCASPLLVQVIANLVENAGHAAGRGGWVAIHGSVRGGMITLEVSDSGPGVPPALRERVFEPFFTTKSPGNGTGLGLSVARAIVHRHFGTLEIRERDGRASFVIELPAKSNLVSSPRAV